MTFEEQKIITSHLKKLLELTPYVFSIMQRFQRRLKTICLLKLGDAFNRPVISFTEAKHSQGLGQDMQLLASFWRAFHENLVREMNEKSQKRSRFAPDALAGDQAPLRNQNRLQFMKIMPDSTNWMNWGRLHLSCRIIIRKSLFGSIALKNVLFRVKKETTKLQLIVQLSFY